MTGTKVTVKEKCKSKHGNFPEHYAVTQHKDGKITCNFCGEVLPY